MAEPTKKADSKPNESRRSEATKKANSSDASGLGKADATKKAHVGQAGSGTRAVWRSQPGAILGERKPGEVLFGRFTVEEQIEPHQRVRSGVYVCRSEAGQKVVVKVAATNDPLDLHLMEKIQELDSSDIIKVLEAKEEDGYFFEVIEYCEGGSLADYMPDPRSEGRAIKGDCAPLTEQQLVDEIIPEVTNGLRILHEEGIVHRDIKPENIFFRTFEKQDVLRKGKDAVLGDFNISAGLEDSSTSYYTGTIAGTWEYSAPESFLYDIYEESERPELDGRIGVFVSRESDYYSLGVSLLKALLGSTPLTGADFRHVNKFYFEGKRLVLPESIGDRLKILLGGLLIRDRKKRWGVEEIQGWLKGTNTEEDFKRIKDDESFARPILRHESYPLEYTEEGKTQIDKARDLHELAALMRRHWEEAKPHLLTRHQTVLFQWIGEEDKTVSLRAAKVLETYSVDPDSALLAFLLVLNPTQGFPVDAAEDVAGPAEIADYVDKTELSQSDGGRSSVWRRMTSWVKPFDVPGGTKVTGLSVWLRNKALPQPELADEVDRIALQSTNPDLALEEILFLLDPERPYRLLPGLDARTTKELAHQIYGSDADWEKGIPRCYQTGLDQFESGRMDTWLRQRPALLPHPDFLEKWQDDKAKFAGRAGQAFEKFLHELNPTLPKIKIVFTGLSAEWAVPFGRVGETAIEWKTIGPGIPFGAVRLESSHPGLHLGVQEFSGRTGSLSIRLNTLYPSVKLSAQNALIIENPILDNSPITVLFSYSVTGLLYAKARSFLIAHGSKLFVAGLMLIGFLLISALISSVSNRPSGQSTGSSSYTSGGTSQSQSSSQPASQPGVNNSGTIRINLLGASRLEDSAVKVSLEFENISDQDVTVPANASSDTIASLKDEASKSYEIAKYQGSKSDNDITLHPDEKVQDELIFPVTGGTTYELNYPSFNPIGGVKP